MTCSRVAVRGAQRALVISDHSDLRHLVQLTLTDPLRRLVYRQSGVSDATSSHEAESLTIRRNYLRQKQASSDCRSFDWYLSNVATSDAVVQPSADVERFGKLRSAGSGLCLGDDAGQRSVELATCSDHVYERRLVVEMTSRGALVRDGRCLEPTAAAAGTAAFAACDKDSPRQRWWLVDGRLSPVTAPRKCLTDSAQHGGQHLAGLEDCANVDERKDSTANQRWSFVNF